MDIVSVEAIVLGTPARERRAADQTHEAALVRITSGETVTSASARPLSCRRS